MDRMPSMPSGLSTPDLAPKNPFSEAQEETMKQESKDLLDKFTKTYLTDYKSELIKKVRADVEAENDKTQSPWKLRQFPDAGRQEVMSGYLTKRGAVIKNWKKRWFVIYSNGACDYFVKEGDAKVKGTIPLEGYAVITEPKGDIFAGKTFTIQLENPNGEDKRVWYLVAETEEEKKNWVQGFSQACRVAVAYVNPDPIVRVAFKSAYTKLRRAYGLYAKNPKGKEEEALNEVVYDRLYSVVVYDVVRNLEGLPKKVAIKFVKGVVSNAVSAAWKGLEESVSRIRPQIEEQGLKKPFVENENKFKEKVNEKINEKLLQPAVNKVLTPFFREVVGIVYPMLMEAMVNQLEVSSQFLLKTAGEITGDNSALVLKEAQKRFSIKTSLNLLPARRMDTWFGKVDLVLRVVSRLEDFAGMVQALRTEINEVLKPAIHIIFPPSNETWMLKLAKNTMYTFEMDYKESGSNDPKVVAKGVVEKLQQDLSHVFKTEVSNSLKEFVRKPYDEFVCNPASGLIEPLEFEIPDDFKDFLDPQGILNDVLEDALNQAVDESAATGIVELNASLINSLSNLSIEARQ